MYIHYLNKLSHKIAHKGRMETLGTRTYKMKSTWIVGGEFLNKLLPEEMLQCLFDGRKGHVQVHDRKRIPETRNSIQIEVTFSIRSSNGMFQFESS